MVGKPIIVGTDGSEESMRAVEWAAREAALRASPLRIVYTPQPSHMSWHQPHNRPHAAGGFAPRSHSSSLASAADRAAELEPALALDTQLLSGSPVRALAEATTGASMLVLGSRWAGAFPAMASGWVSRDAATRGWCPVVVMRQETTSLRREIVVGIGDPDQSAAALGFAFEEASLRKARLTVAHAWTCYLPTPGPSGPVTAAGRPAAGPHHLCRGTGTRLQDMLAPWQEKYPAVETGTEITNAHPAHLLAAASARVDLVVLGRRASGADGSGGRSVIHGVLHHARGPVAVVAD